MKRKILILPGKKLLFHAPIMLLSSLISILTEPVRLEKVFTCWRFLRFFSWSILEFFVNISQNRLEPFLSDIINSFRVEPFLPLTWNFLFFALFQPVFRFWNCSWVKFTPSISWTAFRQYSPSKLGNHRCIRPVCKKIVIIDYPSPIPIFKKLVV